MTGQVIYRRARVSARAWAVPLVLWVVAGIAASIWIGQEQGWVTAVIGGVSVPGIVALVWLLTLWSMNRYGSVVLTTTTLRVGRHTVPVSHLDPTWVEHLAASTAPGAASRLGRSSTTVQLPGQDSVSGDLGHWLGGSYGATLGEDVVTLRLRDGTRVSMGTTDRTGLVAGLGRAVAARAG